MAFGIGSETKEYELVPTGNHPAICYGLIDLGTQQETYEGKQRVAHKIQLLFETPKSLNKEGKPFSIGAKLTCSDDPKATLTKWLVKWRGRDFTPEEKKAFKLVNIVGAGCEIEVIHKEKKGGGTGDLIETVRKLPQGTQLPPLSRPKLIFFISEWNQQVFDSLPQWMKNVIMLSPEYKAKFSPQATQTATQPASGQTAVQQDDGIPF